MGGLSFGVDADGAPVDTSLRTCLKLLAQRGAKLIARHGGAVVEAPRRGSEVAIAWVDAAGIPALDGAGWLTDIGDGRFILSPQGRAIVRLMKAAPSPLEAAAGTMSPPPPPLPEASQPPAVESPLAWLKARRTKDGAAYLSDEAFTAGERLRSDFHSAQLMPRVTADWAAIARTGDERRGMASRGRDLSGCAEAARERVNQALTAMLPEFRRLLLDVCCYELGLEAAGKASDLPQRSAHYVLKLALNMLARHYGLLPLDDTRWQPRGRPRHWATADYRPTMDGV